MKLVTWLAYILVFCMLALALVVVFCGCASITPIYDEHGQIVEVKSCKFMADLSYEQSIEYDSKGKIKKQSIKMETKTNADRILGEINKAAGTLVDGAGKVMP